MGYQPFIIATLLIVIRNWMDIATGQRGEPMSYDIRIAVKVEGAEKGNEYAVIEAPELSSPTYNLGKMF